MNILIRWKDLMSYTIQLSVVLTFGIMFSLKKNLTTVDLVQYKFYPVEMKVWMEKKNTQKAIIMIT